MPRHRHGLLPSTDRVLERQGQVMVQIRAPLRHALGRTDAALLEQLAGTELPLTLLSQYLPLQYTTIREGQLAHDARAILLDGVAQVLQQYAQACRPRNDS